MFLDIIILVLRETLEAGAILSVLLSLSKQHDIGSGWLGVGVLLGVACALAFAMNFNAVGEWFEYAGQEVVNASMQFTIYLCLMACCVMLLSLRPNTKLNTRWISPLFVVAFAFALARELTEMIIFYTGFFQSDGEQVKALTSGFIGLMIGISFGVLCFYAISSWTLRISRWIQVVLLALISAGMAVQTTQLLIQVDIISAKKPIWNTNGWLSESSIFGQIIYAVFGYEATPTQPEAIIYFLSLLSIACVAVLFQLRKPN